MHPFQMAFMLNFGGDFGANFRWHFFAIECAPRTLSVIPSPNGARSRVSATASASALSVIPRCWISAAAAVKEKQKGSSLLISSSASLEILPIQGLGESSSSVPTVLLSSLLPSLLVSVSPPSLACHPRREGGREGESENRPRERQHRYFDI